MTWRDPGTDSRGGPQPPGSREDPSAEIVVVGGGIGGLAAALAVARGGRRVRVLERAPEFAELGAGLQFAPNATRLLDRLGVLERVMDAGVLPRRLVMMDALTGEELTSLSLGAGFRERYGAPYVVMHRSDLLQILLTACQEAGVALETGRDVTSIASGDSLAEARCADGRAVAGAAVIGADGLRSVARRMFSSDEAVGTGYVAYRGAVPLDQVERHADLADVVVWIGPGIHLVQYPLRSGAMYNQVAVFRSPRYAAGHEDWGTPEELDAAFAEAHPHVRESLGSLWRDRRWPMYDREPISTWTSGRVALLGDAAHPMLQYLAQGACQALEDAVSLADRLSGRTDHELPEALRDYQEVRAPATARVQRRARQWGEIWHVDGVARLLRNELLRTRALDDYRHIDWLYAVRPEGGG